MKRQFIYTAITFGIGLGSALAQNNGDEFIGNWLAAQGEGIVQLSRCPLYKNAPATALCGVIVWDAEVDNPKRRTSLDCNRKVFEASKYEDGVWKDGWAFDTRSRKFHSAKLRIKNGHLHMRAFVGNEINGETEIFTRVADVPRGCEGRQPEATSVTGTSR